MHYVKPNLLADEELAEIAARICARHGRDTENMLKTGEELRRVRGGVATKNRWISWFEENQPNFKFSLSTATNYIRAYEWVAALPEADRQVVAESLSIESVVTLSRESATYALKQEVLNMAREAPVRHKQVRELAAVVNKDKKAAYDADRQDVAENTDSLLPEFFRDMTNEDVIEHILQVCARLFAVIQPDAKPDPTLLRDLFRLNFKHLSLFNRRTGKDEFLGRPKSELVFNTYVELVFRQVADFIEKYYVERQFKGQTLRPVWAPNEPGPELFPAPVRKTPEEVLKALESERELELAAE